MSRDVTSFYDDVKFILSQEYRGVKFGIYAVATVGLATVIHRVRPVSKFSRASQVPSHFMRNKEPLKGNVVRVEPAPLRIFVDHRAPIYLPLWHTKNPLPVELWGIELADGNAIGWLECVAVGNNVVMKPISKNKDNLICVVEAQLYNKKTKQKENLNLAQRLVELGFAKVTLGKPKKEKTLESSYAASLASAESKARLTRAGVWSNLPPPPLVVVMLKQSSLKVAAFLSSGLKLLLWRTWGLVKPSKRNQNVI